MKMIKKGTSPYLMTTLLATAGFCCSEVMAQTPTGEDGINASINFQSLYTNNALNTPTDEESERQDQVGATVGGQVSGEWYSASIDYDIDRRFYEKDSQQDQTISEGDVALDIWEGKPVGFFLRQSRRRTFGDPANTPLISNTDQRDIVTAGINGRLQVSGVDSLTLTPIWTDISYKDSPDNDSERLGAQLTWEHKLSNASAFGLTLEQSEVDFDIASQNYTYQRASGFYATQLRQLNYRIEIGVNKNRPDNGVDTDSPYIALLAGYTSGRHSLNFDALHGLTDTSIGNANRTTDVDVNVNTGGSQQFDVYEFTEASMAYQFEGGCLRCRFSFGVDFTDEDYFLVSFNDTQQVGLFGAVDYRLSQSSTLTFASRLLTTEFPSRTDADYKEMRHSLDYRISINEDFRLNLGARWIDRSADLAANEYEEWQALIGITYQLF